MYFLGEKLATLTTPNECLDTYHSGWPIKTSSESLADQICGSGMVATRAVMDLE